MKTKSHFYPLWSPNHDLNLLPVGEYTEPAQDGNEDINRHLYDVSIAINAMVQEDNAMLGQLFHPKIA